MYVTNTRTWQASTDKGGYAILTVPCELTSDDLGDIAEWFGLILRTLQRERREKAALEAPPAVVAVDPHAGSISE